MALTSLDHLRRQPELFSASADPALSRLEDLTRRLVRYASGLSRPRDFISVAHAGHPVGVDARELSRKAISQLAQAIVDWRTAAFIDSGAYSAFRASLRQPAACTQPSAAINFERDVLAIYDRLQDAVIDINAAQEPLPPRLLVMPDVVGDQAVTAALIRQHRHYVAATIFTRLASRAVIPLHNGRLTLPDAYAEITDIVGSDDFIVGVPSNALTISPRQFTDFVARAQPRGIHILGALAESRIAPRLGQLLRSGFEPTWISADACPLRSTIVSAGQGADDRHGRLRAQLGRADRHAELDAWISRQGGIDAVAREYATADEDRRRRILALLRDLGDVTDAELTQIGILPPAKGKEDGWSLQPEILNGLPSFDW